MEIAQSYLSVVMYGRFTIYECRIFIKIVQRANELMKANGGKWSDYLEKAYRLDGFNVHFAVPVKKLIKGSNNYKPIKAAIVNMERNWIVQHYDAKAKKWYATPLIYNAMIDEGKGMLCFQSADWLVRYIADFEKFGFRAYDFEVAMALRNPNILRFYMLTASMKDELAYSIDNLKKWLGVDNKYKRNVDFIRKVVEPARKALEDRNVNGFSYTVVKEGKGKTAAIKYIKIRPRKVKDLARKDAAEVRARIETELPRDLVNYLSYQCGFSAAEIFRIREDLVKFMLRADWQWKMADIVDRARQKRKNHGWIIDAIRGENKK